MSSFDARVRYTRMVIEQSFLELLKQKPAGKITVTELCEKAQINRATFYKHYLDVPDLLEKLEQRLFDRIRNAFADQGTDLKTFLVEMIQYTLKDRELFMYLGGDNGDPNLMTKTFMVCYESAYPLVARNMPELKENERQMLYHYMSHGAGGVLTWWIKDGMREDPQELAQFILSLSSFTADGLHHADWREPYPS